MPKTKTKTKKPRKGRPPEGRVRLYCYVLPATLARIRAEVDEANPTLGRVVDEYLHP